jgi:hypothetical protein
MNQTMTQCSKHSRLPEPNEFTLQPIWLLVTTGLCSWNFTTTGSEQLQLWQSRKLSGVLDFFVFRFWFPVCFGFRALNFGFLMRFVSDFDIRISNFNE